MFWFCARAAGVTWEELLTFLLQKNQAGDESDNNRFTRDLEQEIPPPGASHAAPISQIFRMADKDKYISVGRDSTLRIWQAGTLHLSRVVTLPEKCWVNAAAYSPSDHRLALATAHSKLMIYDTNSFQRPQRVWRLPTAGTTLCLVEQPELSAAWTCALLLGDKEGKCSIYDWQELLEGKFAPRHEVQLHSDWIEKMSLSKEAGGLLSCSADGTLQLHTLTVHGELRLRHKLHSPSGKPITCFAYSVPHASSTVSASPCQSR